MAEARLEKCSADFLTERLRAGGARYARFAETLGDRLWPQAREIYARVLDAYERLYTPARLYATYTLVHGDAHVWNLLYPRDGVTSGIRLIDWDGWGIERAVSDLAYMMAVHWYPERRARLEKPLLKRYHDGLSARGVAGYTLDRLYEDYRLLVIGHLTTPVWQQTSGLHATIWWPHLYRIVTAFDDLDWVALLLVRRRPRRLREMHRLSSSLLHDGDGTAPRVSLVRAGRKHPGMWSSEQLGQR